MKDTRKKACFFFFLLRKKEHVIYKEDIKIRVPQILNFFFKKKQRKQKKKYNYKLNRKYVINNSKY